MTPKKLPPSPHGKTVGKGWIKENFYPYYAICSHQNRQAYNSSHSNSIAHGFAVGRERAFIPRISSMLSGYLYFPFVFFVSLW